MALANNISNKINNQQELSIQISLSGLSFCILQKETDTISFLKQVYFEKKLNPLELLDQLKNVFNSEKALKDTFANVCIIHDNELSTLVPKPLFNADALADYLKFSSKILKSDYIVYDSIILNDSANVYIPYININNFIYDLFGTFTFKHVSTILIESILAIEKKRDTTKIYVNVSRDHFETIVVENAKLILYNTFEYRTKEDFIYYILFTAEQLGLNPETLNLVFIGDIDAKDDLYIMAYKYIMFVFLGNREDKYKYTNDAQPAGYHSNFTLIKSF